MQSSRSRQRPEGHQDLGLGALHLGSLRCVKFRLYGYQDFCCVGWLFGSVRL